jgi:hypothetical protein
LFYGAPNPNGLKDGTFTEGITMEACSHTTEAAEHHFSKGLVIYGLAVAISVDFANRADAIYSYSDCTPAPAYAEFYFNPLAPERNAIKPCRLNVFDRTYAWRHVPVSEYDYVPLYFHFNAGDFIDRWRYYYLDIGRYYYLDRWQYNLLGGSGCLFIYPCYHKRYDCDGCQPGTVNVFIIPEPSTMAFLGLGGLVILGSHKYKKAKMRDGKTLIRTCLLFHVHSLFDVGHYIG